MAMAIAKTAKSLPIPTFKGSTLILVISIILFIVILALLYYTGKCNTEKFAVAEKVDMDTPFNSGTSTGPPDIPDNTNVAMNKPPPDIYASSKKDKTYDDTMPNAEYEKLSKLQLSDSEAKIFHALRTKDLSDENVNQLIESGVINEKLIEKFLSYVDTMDVTNVANVTDVNNIMAAIRPEKMTPADGKNVENFISFGSGGINGVVKGGGVSSVNGTSGSGDDKSGKFAVY